MGRKNREFYNWALFDKKARMIVCGRYAGPGLNIVHEVLRNMFNKKRGRFRRTHYGAIFQMIELQEKGGNLEKICEPRRARKAR